MLPRVHLPAPGRSPTGDYAAQPRTRTGARDRHRLCGTGRTHRGGSAMSSTRIKRAKSTPRRPARGPKRRRKVQTSRLNAVIKALPARPATLQRVAKWTIGLRLAALVAVGAHAQIGSEAVGITT